MAGNNQVGPGNYVPGGMGGQTATSTPTTATTATTSTSGIAGLNNKLGTILPGIKVIPTVNFSLLENLSDDQLVIIRDILKKMNIPGVLNSKGDVKRLFETEPTLKALAAGKTTFPDLRNALLSDLLPGQATAEAITLPSRTISKVNPVVLGEVINGVFEKGLKRKATKEELDALVKEYTPKLEGGTLTEVAKKKNPKTGKLESVTTVTPGMNQQEAEISIEQRIKDMNPEDFDLASRIDFNSWISKNVMGA
jgi:hypothetical protein